MLVVVSLPSEGSFKYRFLRPAHINAREGEALASLAKRLAREGLPHCRVAILLVSAVLLGSESKGRSSARRLNHDLRRLASWALEANLYFVFVWVPSWANPSHCPSPLTSLHQWQARLALLPCLEALGS